VAALQCIATSLSMKYEFSSHLFFVFFPFCPNRSTPQCGGIDNLSYLLCITHWVLFLWKTFGQLTYYHLAMQIRDHTSGRLEPTSHGSVSPSFGPGDRPKVMSATEYSGDGKPVPDS